MNKFSLLAAAFLLTAGLYACKQEEAPTIHIPKTSQTVDPNGGVVDIYLQTNVPNYTVKIEPETADWISPIVSKGETLSVASFSYTANETQTNRSATIVFSSPDGTVRNQVSITQSDAGNGAAKITQFAFLVKDNPELLLNDVQGAINADGTISAYIPHIISSKKLIPSIQHYGQLANAPSGAVDFAQPVTYTVVGADNKEQKYTVSVYANNGIPALWIQTENDAPINSKDVYVKGTVVLDGNSLAPSLEATEMKIKGRGNSTWGLPKKPYKIKFDKKQSMAGFPADKEWVLLANYYDKTLIRNSVAFKLSELIEMDWANRSTPIDVYVNNQYQGSYLLCEQVKIAKDRVNVAELTDADVTEPNITGGYLLELDTNFDETLKFHSATRNLPVMIKEPDLNPTQFAWIEQHFNKVEAVVYGASFADPITGYAQYIDADSFIKWWLIYELMSNWEPNHPKSSYMYQDRGGKLKMGPIWDFDYASCVTTGVFRIKSAIWYGRLFEDPTFVAQAKAIWNQYQAKTYASIINFINQQAVLLQYSSEQDAEKWGRYSYDPSGILLGSFANEVARMKTYFTKRFAWLDKEINAL